MSKWHLIFDVERCNSCNNCVLATKDEYLGNRFESYSEPAPKLGDLWFRLKRHERGAAPMIDVSHYIDTCHQCANAPCITETTRDAIAQRADGIVVIDPVRAKGRRDLVSACPFGQIHWNDELDVPQKYSLDAHLLDAGWTETRAVQVCPTRAIVMAKADDEAMWARAASEGLVNKDPDSGAGQRIWYRRFDRVTHAFLGGTIVRLEGDAEVCAEGLTVRAFAVNGTEHAARTDAFGDFKIEPLAGEGEVYRLQILAPGGDAVLFEDSVALTGSRWVGVIEVGAAEEPTAGPKSPRRA